jgi:hypothetical protein
MDQVAGKLAALAPEGADASRVSDEIARIVALPAGQRPLRVHIDLADLLTVQNCSSDQGSSLVRCVPPMGIEPILWRV